MSLNFLLGFTGVLSFGHAAYFGLGAYGVAMTIKYLVPNTLLAMAVGIVDGHAGRGRIGALIVRRRGVYFAMVTIAFGQVFYFIAFRWNALTGATMASRTGTACPSTWASPASISMAATRSSIISCSAVFAVCVGIMAQLLMPPVRTLVAGHPRERAAGPLPGIPIERHVWLSFVISCLFVSVAGCLMPC